MVNKQNVKLWVDALRSGEFPQGKVKLRRLDSQGHQTYCCMGVACELAVADGVVMDIGDTGSYTVYDEDMAYMPDAVQEWLGIPDPDPMLTSARHESRVRCIKANDELGWSFGQIADAIAARYLKEPREEKTDGK